MRVGRQILFDLFRKFISLNLKLSRFVDELLSARMREDGNRYFQKHVVPKYARRELLVYDVGGGRRPYFSAEERLTKGMRVYGLDIARDELEGAPPGTYDGIIVDDLTCAEGPEDGDLVICQFILEHVPDMRGAVRGVATFLKPGGVALVFLPCRNAAFARLNLILPQSIKRRILFATFPHMVDGHGFSVFYNEAVPSSVKRFASEHGLETIEEKYFYTSIYFQAFFPAYLIWRLWTLFARVGLSRDFCETFILVLRKR